MKSFLTEVIEDLIAKNTDFSNTSLVIPGVRPKSFIKKTFTEVGYRGILPEMKTIEELLQEITSLNLITSVPLLFAAYEAHLTTASEVKTFEDFLKFIPTLLKDFDDIDAAISDDKGLLKSLISEERIKAWGVTMDVGLSEIMKNHLGFWTDAQVLFYQLRNNLLEEGNAYRGLLARKAAEMAQGFIDKSSNHFIFIGFNALTNAEFQIINCFHNAHKAKIYWDADIYYLNDQKQEAGEFLRKFREHFDDFNFINNNFSEPKDFKIINAPRQETQAKYVGNLLREMSAEEREKTAIVLADEQLLPAVLNALPDEVDKLNITMGLPLNMVSMSGFFRAVFNLHLTREKFNRENVYYYRNVLDVLENPNFRSQFQPELQVLRDEINSKNIIFIPVKMLAQLAEQNPFFRIFIAPGSTDHLLQLLIEWIDLIYEKSASNVLQNEYLFRFRSVFMQLRDQTEKLPYITSYKILFQLYQQLLQMESISFVGDPLVGLQLLGMLETRLLDFEHIILTSVNEGILPLGRQENSFIPFDFRKNFGLNTFLENDAIYAYHFYRLIQRCKSATFIYNSDTEALSSSEPSRFLLQLQLESPHQPQEFIATPDYQKGESTLLSIPKTAGVMQFLDKWKERISPTSLSSYLYDPTGFYRNQILKIRQEDEVEEIAGDMTIGTIVHEVLQKIYEPFVNEILTDAHFDRFDAEKEHIFQRVVNEKLLHDREVMGKNVLILKVAREMVRNVLHKDRITANNNELIIISLENDFDREFITPQGNQVKFLGKIDRIDTFNGITRILDYKTGSVKKLDISTAKFDGTLDKEQAQIIQLAIYAYMSGKDNIMCGIYPMRYFTKDVQLLTIDKDEILTQQKIIPLMQDIGHLIDEIFNPELPFMEPEDSSY